MDLYWCKCWGWDEIIGFLGRRIIETIFAPAWSDRPCTLTEWKIENYKKWWLWTGGEPVAQSIFKFVGMQPSCKELLLQHHKRKIISQRERQSILPRYVLLKKWKWKNKSLSGEMCPWSFKSIQRSATKSSHFLSAFCPLFAIWTQPHLLILSYPELDVNFLRLRTISRNPEDYQRINKNLLKKNSQNHSGCLKIS